MSRAKPYQARSDAPESGTELSNFEKNDAVPDTRLSLTAAAARDRIAGIGIEDRARTKLERLYRCVIKAAPPSRSSGLRSGFTYPASSARASAVSSTHSLQPTEGRK